MEHDERHLVRPEIEASTALRALVVVGDLPHRPLGLAT
jgi:hypothetical protein